MQSANANVSAKVLSAIVNADCNANATREMSEMSEMSEMRKRKNSTK